MRSTQNGTGSVTSVNFSGLIGASLGGSAAGGVTFGVVDNALMALARMNAADNRLEGAEGAGRILEDAHRMNQALIQCQAVEQRL